MATDTLCANTSIIYLTWWSYFPSGFQLHVPHHFLHFQDQGMTVVTYFSGIRDTCIRISLLCIVEHRHEYNSSLKLFWIYLSSVQIVLHMSENLNRRESWDVNGRSASGDLTMRPLLSTSEDLGIKTDLLAANSAGTGQPSITCLYALERN